MKAQPFSTLSLASMETEDDEKLLARKEAELFLAVESFNLDLSIIFLACLAKSEHTRQAWA